MIVLITVLTFKAFGSSSAIADTLWLVGQEKPVHGIVESIENAQISFQQTSNGREFQRIEIAQRSIQTMIVNFDATRLSNLAHGDWDAWYEYAEELMPQKQDPVARVLARRLLVIVAGNSKEADLRKAALSDLISLTQNEVQKKKLRQLYYLETGDKSFVEQNTTSATLPPMEQRKAAAERVNAIRRGRDVGQLANNESLKSVISSFEETCSWQELIQISRSNRIDNRSLRRLVALELELLTAKGSRESSDSKNEWHILAGRAGASTLSLPSIDNVTEFDPQETSFQNGKWSRR